MGRRSARQRVEHRADCVSTGALFAPVGKRGGPHVTAHHLENGAIHRAIVWLDAPFSRFKAGLPGSGRLVTFEGKSAAGDEYEHIGAAEWNGEKILGGNEGDPRVAAMMLIFAAEFRYQIEARKL